MGHFETGEKEKKGKFEGSDMKARSEGKEIVKRALAMLHSKPEPGPSLSDKGQTVEAQEVRERANSIQAVKICSHVLEDEIWLILDREFIPHDGLAVYYPEEIPLLNSKTPEQLREIHKYKLVFPGARVIQEGPDGQRKGNALPKLETLNPKR